MSDLLNQYKYYCLAKVFPLCDDTPFTMLCVISDMLDRFST
jgi:hypothetical protein